jgi:phosphate transport system permease protein
MAASATTATRPSPFGFGRTIIRGLRSGDAPAYLITIACGATVVAITTILAYQLFDNSTQSRHAFGWSFLSGTVWDVPNNQFGALPFIFGTVVTSFLALAMAVPLGVGAAIFLAELAPPRISDALTFLIELLAAVPSVIFGLLAIFILEPALGYIVPWLKKFFSWTPFFDGDFIGPSIFTATIVLGIMIIPFIISISREVIRQVPNDQREAGLALGATRWETTWDVVIPFARKGIMGSIFLALARALGETMAVTMVIGNDPHIKASLLAPGYSIAAVVSNELKEATAGTMQLSALFEVALVLFALTIAINAFARLLVISTTRKGSS